MKAYMAHDGHPEEVAFLVWAHSHREAKRIAQRNVPGYTDCEFIDVRVRRIRDLHDEWLTIMPEEPGFVDNPPGCESCCLWQPNLPFPVDGVCADCREIES